MKNKIISTLIIILIYAIMLISYIFLEPLLKINDIIIKLFIVTLIWTTYLGIFSLLFKNIEIFKLFWFIAPIFLVTIYAKTITELNIQSYLIIICLGLWSLKSVINWIIRFKNLIEKDWRQIYYEEKYQKWWPIFNLFAYHFGPMIIIYLGIVPIFYYISYSTFKNINLSTIIGLLIMIAGIIIEMLADEQMNKFKRITKDQLSVNQTGLWKFSRHPNYLGELMVWWGSYLMMLSLDESKFLLFLGPLLITLLILIIRIPLMEKHELKNKYDYKEYMENTNILLIFPKKSKSI